MNFTEALELSKSHPGSVVKRSQSGKFEVLTVSGDTLRSNKAEPSKELKGQSSEEVHNVSDFRNDMEQLSALCQLREEKITWLEQEAKELRSQIRRLKKEITQLEGEKKAEIRDRKKLARENRETLANIRKEFYSLLELPILEEIWSKRENSKLGNDEIESLRLELRKRKGFQPAPDAKKIPVCSGCFLPLSACICRGE